MSRVLEPYEEVGACGLVANLAGVCADGTLDGAVDVDDDGGLLPERKALAYELARLALNHLTAGITANCPASARPCRAGDMGMFPWSWTGLAYIPPEYLTGNIWISSCGCGQACACSPRGALDLNGHVAEIVSVEIDGVVVPDTEYRLMEGRYLYRIGGAWPVTQDMSIAPGGVGTFVLTYRPGFPLGTAGEAAYGRLAAEFAKALCGDSGCAFPKNVKSVVRAGVMLEFKDGLFPGGLTGIREVDAYVASVNPYGVKTLTSIVTPESLRRRRMRHV